MIFSRHWETPETFEYNYFLPTLKSHVFFFFFQSFKILRQTLKYSEARHSWCKYIPKGTTRLDTTGIRTMVSVAK